MAFTKTTWIEDVTAVSAAQLNRMEQGIADAHAMAVDVDPDVMPLQHGVLYGGGLTWINANTQRIAAGRGLVKLASGLLRPVTWAQTDVTIPTSTGNRVDQIVVSSAGVVSRLAGAEQAAGGFNLDSRTGAANAEPGSGYLRLYDILATAAQGGTPNAATYRMDRRPWAKGYTYTSSEATAGGGNGTRMATQRAELSGAPVLIEAWFEGEQGGNATAGSSVSIYARDVDNGDATIIAATGEINYDGDRPNPRASTVWDPVNPVAGALNVNGSHRLELALGLSNYQVWGTGYFSVLELPGRRYGPNNNQN